MAAPAAEGERGGGGGWTVSGPEWGSGPSRVRPGGGAGWALRRVGRRLPEPAVVACLRVGGPPRPNGCLRLRLPEALGGSVESGLEPPSE